MRTLLRAACALPILLLALSSSVAPACTTWTVRKEWRTLSDNERAAYIDAVRKMQVRSAPNKPSLYDALVQMHVAQSSFIHGVALFLPWHRFYLFFYEKLLQKINPAVAVPYWNWQMDSQTPELAEFFSDDARIGLGTNGDPGNDYCVMDGAFKDWQPFFPQPHCLRRKWTESDRIQALYSPENIANVIYSNKNYAAFRPAIERVPHGQVHTAIGGDVGDLSMMYSPNDPIFFLHHANIDLIWENWQRVNDGFKQYGGPYDKAQTREGNFDDILPGLKTKTMQFQVKHAMNNAKLCVKYQLLDGSSVEGTGLPTPNVNAQLLRRRLWRRSPNPLPIPGDVVAADALVTVKQAAVPRNAHYCARKYLNLLLTPGKVPTVWIMMNGFEKEEVRKDEERHVSIITGVNDLKGYVSVASTLNIPDRFASLTKNIETFAFYDADLEVLVQHTDPDQKQAASNMMARVQASLPSHKLQVQPDDVRDKLIIILGGAGKNSNEADNPWRTRTIVSVGG